MGERTKRGESKHPGVQIVMRLTSQGPRYFARWNDPKFTRTVPMLDDNGEPVLDKRSGRPRMHSVYVREEESLDKHGLRSDKARETWCKAKANNIRAEAAAIAAGEKVTSETLVPEAFKAYYKNKNAELQPATLVAYQQGTKPFETWCAKNAVVYIETVTPPLLAMYREWFVSQKAYTPAKGPVGKGKRVEGKGRRSPAQTNKCLNSLRVVLTQLRRQGLAPALTSDDIVDSLKFVKRERSKRRYLDVAQVKALLEAAQRQDADGHPEIAPFTAACVLTGMRFHELCDLTFEEVDAVAGEIHLAARRTKTMTERTVYLDKLPTLWAWLKQQKLAAGGKGRVFPHLTFAIARIARARLVSTDKDEGYSAPVFTWHRLRATCGTYSVCSSLYGRGSEHETAQQLGHSIQVAQVHYTGRAKDFLPDAASLEEAMFCANLFTKVFATKGAKREEFTQQPTMRVGNARA
ncbi:MAG: tyrosine-type recombinase/integrase [Planctomycetes bacterium]|nr:tyrosine-type recombinase/integrase [Planctomycetota bacterium]